MANIANATLSVQISGGPAVAVNWQMAAEGMDRVTVTVPRAGNKSVDLQPGAAAKLLLVVLTASAYDATLTYKLDPAGATFKLTQPQVISGGDLVVQSGATN